MDPGLEVRRLTRADLTHAVTLRREALTKHPLAFGASLEDDPLAMAAGDSLGPEDPNESVILGAFADGALVGMVGVFREADAKRRHRAYLWGMYVAEGTRARGAGRGLLEAAIAQARAWPGITQLRLSVTDAAEAARRLYDAAGFVEWGRDREALAWDGFLVDETQMVLHLDARADG
jgi:ribosomal protein S18 acetylase RimI-like enzyme